MVVARSGIEPVNGVFAVVVKIKSASRKKKKMFLVDCLGGFFNAPSLFASKRAHTDWTERYGPVSYTHLTLPTILRV